MLSQLRKLAAPETRHSRPMSQAMEMMVAAGLQMLMIPRAMSAAEVMPI